MAKQQNDLLKALGKTAPVKGPVKVDLNAIYRAQQAAKNPYQASESAAIPAEELELKTEELLVPEFTEKVQAGIEASQEQLAEELVAGATERYQAQMEDEPIQEVAFVPPSELSLLSGQILETAQKNPYIKEKALEEMRKSYGKYGITFEMDMLGNYVARSGDKSVEVNFYRGDVNQSVENLKGFIAKNAKKTQYDNPDFIDLSEKARTSRTAGRQNADGTVSTHLFSTVEVDGKHYAVPTLFPKNPGEQSSDPNAWMEIKDPKKALEEATRRGELYQFDTKSQADAFAKGAWKKVNEADLMRKKVAEERGVSYGAMKQSEIDREYLRDEVRNLETAIDILSDVDSRKEPLQRKIAAKMKKAYGVDTPAGLEKVLQQTKEKRNATVDFFETFADIRQEADRRTEAERKKYERQAVALNNEVKKTKETINTNFYNYFGVPFLTETGEINPEIKKVKPADIGSAQAYNEAVTAYNLLIQRQKQAAQVYLKERTYLDAKYDKEAQDKYVGELEGIMNSIRSNWNQSNIQKVILDAQVARLVGEEEKLAMYNKQMHQMLNDPTISTAMSATQERLMEIAESGELGDYIRALGANPVTFISAVANMSAGSIARMVPILFKTGSPIVGVTTAIGGIAGGIPGARIGFGVGMEVANAASGFALEYSASVLEAVQKKYNTIEEAQKGEWLEDPEIWAEAADIGVKRGLAVTFFNAATARLLDIIKPMSIASTARRTTQAVGTALAIEPVSEALGEYAAQVVSGQEINGVEVLGEALGSAGMSSNPLTLANVVYQQTRADYYTNLAEKMSQSRSFLNGMDEDLGKITSWTNNMRSTGQITAATEQQILENVSSVREARQLMSSTSPTNTQRVSEFLFGTKTAAEDRLADLLLAKKKMDATPSINKPLQASVQDEITYILENKKLPAKEARINLAPVIGATPKYYINGKAALREEVSALLDPTKTNDDDLKGMNVSIDGDPELEDVYLTRMETIFDADEYDGGKITLASEDINEIPEEFRESATFNEETGRHEVSVDAADVEGKDVASIAVRPAIQLDRAMAVVKEGKPVYAKDVKTGEVFVVEGESKLKDAHSRGMVLLLDSPSTRGVRTHLPPAKIKVDRVKAVKTFLNGLRADTRAMNSFGTGITKSAWNFAIDTAILAIEAGESTTDAVKKAADYIDSVINVWSKTDFVAYMTGQMTEKEKEIVEKARYIPIPAGLNIVDGWYSTIEKRVLESSVDKQSATKWLGLIGKSDEAIYTGVRGWLESKKPDEQVTKEEIAAFMKDNRVEIKEINLGEKLSRAASELDKRGYSVMPGMPGSDEVLIKDSSGELVDFEDLDAETQRLVEEITSARFDENGIPLADTPMYQQYKTQGPYIDYREILVTLPPKSKPKYVYEPESGVHQVSVLDKKSDWVIRNTETNEILKRYKSYQAKVKEDVAYMNQMEGDITFKGSHFAGRENILVHLRLTTRVNQEGKSVLYIEEVQSDWGQEGRGAGFENIEEKRKSLEMARGRRGRIMKVEKKMELYQNNVGSFILPEGMPFTQDFADKLHKMSKDELREAIEKARKERIERIDRLHKESINKVESDLKNGLVSEKFATKVKRSFDVKRETSLELLKRNHANSIDDLKKIKPFIPGELEQYELDNLYDQNIIKIKAISGPFVTDTNAWIKLGLKMAIREAARTDVDKIVWANSEQQYMRWNSDEVHWRKTNDGKFKLLFLETLAGPLPIDARFKNDSVTVESEEDIVEVIMGRTLGPNLKTVQSLAKKVWKKMQEGDPGPIRPRLEGMQAFYDRQLGEIFKSLVKELTGREPEITKTGIDIDVFKNLDNTEFKGKLDPDNTIVDNNGKLYHLQQSIDLTPQLKEQIKRGIPLFDDEKISVEQRAERIRQKMFAMKAKIDQSVRPQILDYKEQDAIRKVVRKLAWRIGVDPNNIDFIADPNERWKGRYNPANHSISINFSYVTPDTPFHEVLAHPIIHALKNGNQQSRALYDNLVKELMKDPGGIAAMEMVKSLYPEYTFEEQVEEALVTLLGELASEKFEKAKNLGQKFLSLLNELWSFVSNYVAELLGQQFIKVEDLKPTTTIKELAEIMGYGSNLIVLPGADIIYTTPTGTKHDTIEGVKQEMARAGAATTLDFPSDPGLGRKIKLAIIKRMIASESNPIEQEKRRSELIDLLADVKHFRYYDAITGRTLDFKADAISGVWYVTDSNTGEYIGTRSYYDESQYNKEAFSPFVAYKENEDPRLFIRDYATSLSEYYLAESPFAYSKYIVERWKKINQIKYNPQEAYDRGYGFYHYLSTGMVSSDATIALQNIGRFLELNEKTGGQYAVSATNRLASLPISSPEETGANFWKSGIRIAIYPNPEDILFMASEDAYTGTTHGQAVSRISPFERIEAPTNEESIKQKSRIGRTLLKYPSPESLEYVTSTVLESMLPIMSSTLKSQNDGLSGSYNESGIVLKKGRFKIEYDERVVNSEVRRMIDLVNNEYGIKEEDIPAMGEYNHFGIKVGSLVVLEEIDGFSTPKIKITDINENKNTFSGLVMNDIGDSIAVDTESKQVVVDRVFAKGQIKIYDIPFDRVNPGEILNYEYAQGAKPKKLSKSDSLKNFIDRFPDPDYEARMKKKIARQRALEALGFYEAMAQATREYPMALVEASVSFSGFGPSPETVEQFKYSRVPESKDTLFGAINEARNEGYTDGEIKRMLMKDGYSVSDINDAMAVSIGDWIEIGDKPMLIAEQYGLEPAVLPKAFGQVEGGAFAGYSMYTNVKQKVRRYARGAKGKAKPTMAQVREYAQQELAKHPLFQSSSEYLQMSLMNALDASLNTTANKAIQAQMKRIREAIRNMDKGARELNDIRRKLTTLIKASLPRTMYTKAEVMDLLKRVSAANRANIAEIQREVADFVIGIRVRDARAKLAKLLDVKTTKKEGDRAKGTMSIAMQERVAKLKAMLPADKATTEEIVSAIKSLKSRYDDLEEKVITEGKEEFAEEMSDVEFALKYSATMLMDDIEENKLVAMDEMVEYMREFLKTGRAAFSEELKAQSRYYNSLKRQLLQDITGGDYKVNFNDQKEVNKASRKLEGEGISAEKQKGFGVALRDFVDSTINALLRRTEDLTGLVDRISNMTGEFFGGVSKRLIVDRVRTSRANLNKLNVDTRAFLQDNAQRIFGKNWKKVMIENGKKKFTYIRDPKAYAKVLKTGNKIAIDAFLLENDVPISQNEMYYLYNQFKDPANHPGFETKFGEDYKEIMAEITSKLDPKVKEWADWQVEVFYPSVYPIYNETYRRVYRTDLPWNQFYAGRIYREAAEGEATPSLMSSTEEFMTSIGAASTKERVANNKAIKSMDGDKVLASYVRDMNFFASYAETIRDIKKMLNNSVIRKAIETRAGKDIYRILTIMTKRLESDGFGKGREPDLLDVGFRNFVYAKLGLNPKIMLAQASSFVGFIPFVGYGTYSKYARAAFSDLYKGKNSTAYQTWKEMMENSAYLKVRFEDSNIIDIMATYTSSKLDTTLGGEKGLSIDNYANVLMYFIKQGDKAGVIGSVPNYLYYKDEYMKKRKAAKQSATEKDAIAYALRKIEAQVKSVAQSNDIEDKDFYQTYHAVVRSFQVFLSQPKQYFRLEMYAIRNIYKQLMGLSGAKGTLRENLRLFVTMHFVAPVLFQYLMLGLPGILTDFDDDDDEELLWAGVIGNLNAIFVAGDIFTKIRDIATGKPWATETTSISAFSVIADLAKEINAAVNAKTDETRTKHLVKFSLLMAELGGIPAPTVYKLANNWIKVAKGDVDNFGEAMLRLFNFSEYVTEKKPKKEEEQEFSFDTYNFEEQ